MEMPDMDAAVVDTAIHSSMPSSDPGVDMFDPSAPPVEVDSPSDASTELTNDQTGPLVDGNDLWPDGHPSQRQDPAQNPDLPPKKNPSRFEYWQSQATQLKNQLDGLQGTLQEAQPYLPIVQYLKENPQVLERLAVELDGSPAPTPGVSSSQPSPQVDQPLQRPVRPAHYDSTEAVTDPNSESFKYREALLDYQEKLTASIEQREAQRVQAEREAALEAQRQQLYRQQLIQTQTSLQAKYGFSQEEAMDFIRTMSDPRTLQLDGMVRYYRALKPSKAKPPVAPTRQELLRRPVPPSVAGGQAELPPDDETAFNLSLLSESRPPWARQARK